ncbi:MAG: efflux RND transporter periplasmic adaptor subunit [Balneolaceae bacterium]
MKWKTLLPAALMFMIAVTGCEPDDEAGEDQSERTRYIPVETVTVTPDSFDDYIRITGVVEAIEDATVSSESSGRIHTILERGESVEEGAIIANMDDRLLRSRFEAARTSFELADDTFNRLESLYEEEIISTQDYRSAKAQRDQAGSQLEQAEKQLRDTHVEAPFRGRIEERFVRTGELVNPGMPVVRLVNTDTVRITAGVPERYSGQIVKGSPVTVRLRSYDGSVRESTISFAGNVIDSATRTFPVEIELPNVGGSIKPEMVVDLHVKRRTIENAVIVPRTSIVRDEDGIRVFIVKDENDEKVAELVTVNTGPASGPVIEVTEGLQEGDEVIVTGISTLSVGDRLNVLSNRPSSEYARDLQRRDRSVLSY